MITTRQNLFLFLLPLLIFLPIFFQLNHGLFDSREMNFNSGGALLNLPIPISALACLFWILVLGRYQAANASLTFIFFSFILMLVSVVITTGNDSSAQLAKFILMIQFLLPMFGLVLGQMYVAQIKAQKLHIEFLRRPLFYLLMIIPPVQLATTWWHGSPCLIPYLSIFSIYQHLQYVPMIFVCAYLIVMYTSWSSDRSDQLTKWLLVFLSVVMCLYAVASMSMVALVAFLTGLVIFAVYRIKTHKDWALVLLVVLCLIFGGGYAKYAKEYLTNIDCGFSIKVSSVASVNESSQAEARGGRGQSKSIGKNFSSEESLSGVFGKLIPLNLSERLTYWSYYVDKLIDEPRLLLFGAKEAPSRKVYPSAHNYYLDLLYNFGIFAMSALIFLIIYTVYLIRQNHRAICSSPYLVSLCVVAFLLVLIDNSIKVTFRQPYPGIIVFFLWGMLITELHTQKSRKA